MNSLKDTHYHGPLKAQYRKLEQSLMLEKLKRDKSTIASPDRDEIMQMVCEAMENTKVDKVRAFKSLFFTNALDGSEDDQVNDKLFKLIGPEVQEFRQNLMKEKPLRNLEELLNKIIPPKGVKSKNNIEGSELLDCDGEELQTTVENEVLKIPDEEKEGEEEKETSQIENEEIQGVSENSVYKLSS